MVGECDDRPSTPFLLPTSGVGGALLSAALFGLASPFAKLLIGDSSPVLVAGLLYFWSGLGLSAFWMVTRHRRSRAEASLGWRDLPWLAVTVGFGGILGPALQMIGLVSTPASTVSLLLNLEGVFTAIIAWTVFRESVDRRIFAGMVLVTAGGVVLSWPGRISAPEWGVVAVVGACAAWAIDNNATRRLSSSDPIQIAAIKGLVAGGANVVLGLTQPNRWPDLGRVIGCGILGLLAYGGSLVLFVLAMRRLGAARTAAYFSLAPFVGTGVALVLLGEKIGAPFLLGAVLMAAGILLHLTERHGHLHHHQALEHNHRHVHDEHHRHAHGGTVIPGEPHAHPHRHEPLAHSHEHRPDAHHLHQHRD